MKPFRWNIRRREQLGRLLEGERVETYTHFADDLRQAAARSLAMAGDARWVFIGRSPESIFDYLSGVVGDGVDGAWAERLALVNLSLRDAWPNEIRNGRGALRDHLESEGLAPRAIASSPRPVAVIDLVASGETFETLVREILLWADDERVDRAAVRRRIRLVGITRRTKTSPNTDRWHQNAAWLRSFPRILVKNVSIPARLWLYLGNEQPKVTGPNPPWRWTDPEIADPPRHSQRLAALRHAVAMFDLGSTREERERFAATLARTPAMKDRWCRDLVTALRA